MSEPKLDIARIDLERLAGKLLDAINSAKRIPVPRTLSSDAKVGFNSLSEEKEQRPPQMAKSQAKTFEPVEAEEPEDFSAAENAEISATPDCEIEAQSSPNEVFEEFCGDQEFIQRLQVTPAELRALSRVSLLGTLTSKQDLLFMLRRIRERYETLAR